MTDLITTHNPSAASTIRWAVIGMGRAGQSRVRVIEANPESTLAARVSRRPGLGDTPLEDVLADEAIDAVIIATENASHGRIAKAALNAGKHVLVEYPLAQSAQEVDELRALADSKGLVLHLEMIGLLTGAHQAVADWAPKQDISRVELAFQGGFYRWVEDEAKSGRWGQLAIARLHALDACFGPLALSHVGFSHDPDGYDLSARFHGANEVVVDLKDSRRRDQRRGKTQRFMGGDGVELTPPPSSPVSDLFGADLQCCIDQIFRRREGGYVDLSKASALTRMAEAISHLCLVEE